MILDMLTVRQIKILEMIIHEHIKRAEPVGSEDALWKKLKVSPATIRNEMQELEKSGFLTHPHTSAGRVPTEKGYKYFIENLTGEYCVKDSEKRVLTLRGTQGVSPNDFETIMKHKAKSLSNLTSEAVILSFGNEYSYYTGLTNLFSKPEFKEIRFVVSFSEILDELDEAVHKLFEEKIDTVKILIGNKNPFGENCSAIVGSYRKGGRSGILAILGPRRMDYERNTALLKYVLGNLLI